MYVYLVLVSQYFAELPFATSVMEHVFTIFAHLTFLTIVLYKTAEPQSNCV